MLVIAGFQGKPVAELGHERPSSPAQDDPGRDQVLAQAPNALEVHAQSPRDARRAREHARLNTRVGELPREFNQSDADPDEAHADSGMPRAA